MLSTENSSVIWNIKRHEKTMVVNHNFQISISKKVNNYHELNKKVNLYFNLLTDYPSVIILNLTKNNYSYLPTIFSVGKYLAQYDTNVFTDGNGKIIHR